MQIKKGQIVMMKTEFLEPGEVGLFHVAVENSWRGSVRVTVLDDIPNMMFKPINDWRLEWIAE